MAEDALEQDGRAPVLDLMGPRTVKEVEALVFVAARGHDRLEAAHRTWLEDDRSYFIRWREDRPGAPPQVIGLVHADQLPEMASRIRILSFEDELHPALREYAELLRQELNAEGFV